MRRWLSLARIGLTSTLGGGTLPVLGVVVALAVYAFGYANGAQQQKEECRTAELETQVESQRTALERIQEQLRAANTARDNANDRAARDAALLDQAKEEADAFTQTLHDRPDACPVSSHDAERLRRIGQ